jgi:hypothetical protein
MQCQFMSKVDLQTNFIPTPPILVGSIVFSKQAGLLASGSSSTIYLPNHFRSVVNFNCDYPVTVAGPRRILPTSLLSFDIYISKHLYLQYLVLHVLLYHDI